MTISMMMMIIIMTILKSATGAVTPDDNFLFEK